MSLLITSFLRGRRREGGVYACVINKSCFINSQGNQDTQIEWDEENRWRRLSIGRVIWAWSILCTTQNVRLTANCVRSCFNLWCLPHAILYIIYILYIILYISINRERGQICMPKDCGCYNQHRIFPDPEPEKESIYVFFMTEQYSYFLLFVIVQRTYLQVHSNSRLNCKIYKCKTKHLLAHSAVSEHRLRLSTSRCEGWKAKSWLLFDSMDGQQSRQSPAEIHWCSQLLCFVPSPSNDFPVPCCFEYYQLLHKELFSHLEHGESSAPSNYQIGST